MPHILMTTRLKLERYTPLKKNLRTLTQRCARLYYAARKTRGQIATLRTENKDASSIVRALLACIEEDCPATQRAREYLEGR